MIGDTLELLEIKTLVDKKIVSESLTRIGIADKARKILYPSCYLYEANGKTYIAHFKQLFKLENPNALENILDEDILRRNAIAFCLKNWKLIDFDSEKANPHTTFVFVLPFKNKSEWQIVHKFTTANLKK